MLKPYPQPNNNNNLGEDFLAENKQGIIILSSGTLRPFQTQTNDNLYHILNTNYNIFGLETAGHGENRTQSFSYNQLKDNLYKELEQLNSNPVLDKQKIHFIGNSIPGLLYMHILNTEKELQDLISSITALAPALNIPGAINTRVNNKVPQRLQSLLSYALRQTYLHKPLDLIRSSLHKNYNVALSYLLSLQKEFNYEDNIQTISKLNEKIPTHIIYNIEDLTVQNHLSSKHIRDLLEANNVIQTNKIAHIDGEQDTHRIYPNKEFDLTTVPGVDTGNTIGEAIKKFIDQHNA